MAATVNAIATTTTTATTATATVRMRYGVSSDDSVDVKMEVLDNLRRQLRQWSLGDDDVHYVPPGAHARDELFGDPSPMRRKKVFVLVDGKVVVGEFEEHQCVFVCARTGRNLLLATPRMGFRVLYGVSSTTARIDVTEVCMERLFDVHEGTITLPGSDSVRDALFGDPCPGVLCKKSIFVTVHGDDEEEEQHVFPSDIVRIQLRVYDDGGDGGGGGVYLKLDSDEAPAPLRRERRKLVVCVFGCVTVERYRLQVEAVNATWRRRLEADNERERDPFFCIEVLFFLGEERHPAMSGAEYVYLPGVGNDYASASYKQFLGLRYIFERFHPDFVYCCGTDTYVNAPKLRRFVCDRSMSGRTDARAYIGGDGFYRTVERDRPQYYYHDGGAGVFLTHSALESLYFPLLLLGDAEGGTKAGRVAVMDHWTRLCRQHSVEYLQPACDVCLAYYLGDRTEVLRHQQLFRYCTYLGAHPCGVSADVDVRKIVTCHHMSLEDFREFTQLLENNDFYLGFDRSN